MMGEQVVAVKTYSPGAAQVRRRESHPLDSLVSQSENTVALSSLHTFDGQKDTQHKDTSSKGAVKVEATTSV